MHPPVRLVAIDIDGTLLPGVAQPLRARTGRALMAAQKAGIVVAIATGRRVDYTTPVLDGLNLDPSLPLITSNGVIVRTLGGEQLDNSHLEARIARGLCTLLRPYGSLVFTFDHPHGSRVILENIDQATGRLQLWIEANRKAIEEVPNLEAAMLDGENPIQGMAAGSVYQMREAEKAILDSPWASECECVKTEYPARDLSILDLLPLGISKGWALQRLAARLGIDRKEVMAIGDNWNDLEMLKFAGQAVLMGNAPPELRVLAKTTGWRLAPRNDQDGVAVILEEVLAKQKAALRN
jgi:hypothetical protein